MIWYRDKYSMLLVWMVQNLRVMRKIMKIIGTWQHNLGKKMQNVCEMMACGTRMLEIHHFYFFNKSVVDMF